MKNLLLNFNVLSVGIYDIKMYICNLPNSSEKSENIRHHKCFKGWVVENIYLGNHKSI